VPAVLTLAACGLLTTAPAAPAHAVPAPQGTAWPGISDEIDDLVEDMISDESLPGVSVAAAADGRLVVSRGYGYADTAAGTPLDDDDQIFIGSNTKPLITGASAWRLLDEAGLDPATTPLYGPDGVLGTDFDGDIAVGAAATGTPAEWYDDITVQHLFDHRSGFRGGGDAEGAAEMFGVDVEDVTYAQIHSHFLRTRALGSEPGAVYDYSNHGFGSLSLVVEELSGLTYNEYVVAHHLAPRGLDGEVERINDPFHAATAIPHRYVDGEPVPYEPEVGTGGQGAAGGWRSSSRDLVELMTSLAGEYSPREMDRMGWGATGVSAADAWGDDDTGVLSHNGRLSGGTSHVRMTVDGVFVAVQTNISNPDAPLSEVAAAIVELIRDADIPEHYDIWAGCTLPAVPSGHAQVARHGVPAARYQCEVDRMVAAGYRPDWVDAFDVAGTVRFNALFVPAGSTAWSAFHGLSGAGYQDRFDALTDAGYRPEQVDSYLDGGRVRYAGLFVREPGSGFVAYHGLTAAAHQDRFEDLRDRGYRPTSVSVVATGGERRYTAVYDHGVEGSFWLKSRLSPEQYRQVFDRQLERGRRPVYLNGYTDTDGSPRLAVVFASEPDGPFRARHGLTSAQYQAAWNEAVADGLRTEVVTGYDDGGARYAAVWGRP
jgi:CubicO group peptidase (beta-lactamase class C family)